MTILGTELVTARGMEQSVPRVSHSKEPYIMFSCVIPTMWKYPPFTQFLKGLERHPLIDEIILINNCYADTPNGIEEHIANSSKIHHYIHDKFSNMGVNPAWNLGVSIAKNNKIALINDDLIFDLRVFDKVSALLDAPTTGVIGLCPGDHPAITNQPSLTTGIIDILPHPRSMHRWGFGMLMFVRKDTWEPIPHEMKIFCGDDWIIEGHLLAGRQNYIIANSLWRTPYSVTSREYVDDYEIHDRQIFAHHHAKRIVCHHSR
jgi:hypothetical protein